MSEISKGAMLGLAVTFVAAEVAACSASAPETPPATETSSVVVYKEDPRQDAYDHLPHSPCETTPAQPADPAACALVHRAARIAVVNFDASPQEAAEVASHMKKPLEQMTASIVRVQTADVIPASPVARAKAQENRGAKNCVTSKYSFASVAAQETMPTELAAHKYDFVLALTKADLCPDADKDVVAGMADGIPGRYADLFRPAQANSTDPHFKTAPQIVGVHEAGHLFGLGHESLLHCERPPALTLSTDLDVDAYLTPDCTYAEYSHSPVGAMGSWPAGPSIDTVMALPPQLPALLQQEAAGRPAVTPEIVLGRDAATITQEDADNNKFFSVRLRNKISPPGQSDLLPYDRLAIVPGAYTGSHTRSPRIVQLMLVNSYNSVLVLEPSLSGHEPGEDGKRTIRVGGQKIALTLGFAEMTAQLVG